MIKNLDKYVDYLKNRGMDAEGSVFAQILKNERLKHNLTLSELSYGICSVSYLSKLENSIIKSNDLFYRQLFEKMDIDYDKVNENNFTNVIGDVIKSYFYRNNDELKRLAAYTAEVPYNTNNSLIRCFYYLATGRFDLFRKEHEELAAVKETLGSSEALVYIYLAVAFYLENYRFREALAYLKITETLECKNKYLYFLFLEANIVTASFLGIGARLITSYRELNRKMFVGYPAGRKLELQMLCNLYLASEYPQRVFEDIETVNFDEVPNENRFNVLLYTYLIKIRFRDPKLVFDDIYQKGYFIDVRFLGLLAYCTYRLNDEKFYRKLLEIVDEYKFDDRDKMYQRFICFVLFYATDVTDEDLLLFIRSEILPLTDVENYGIYNDIYTEVYLGLLRKQSRYKEAFLFLGKNDPRLCRSGKKFTGKTEGKQGKDRLGN